MSGHIRHRSSEFPSFVFVTDSDREATRMSGTCMGVREFASLWSERTELFSQQVSSEFRQPSRRLCKFPTPVKTSVVCGGSLLQSRILYKNEKVLLGGSIFQRADLWYSGNLWAMATVENRHRINFLRGWSVESSSWNPPKSRWFASTKMGNKHPRIYVSIRGNWIERLYIDLEPPGLRSRRKCFHAVLWGYSRSTWATISYLSWFFSI